MTTAQLAQYDAKCHECGLRIEAGVDTIERGYRSWRHTDCTAASLQRQIRQHVAAGWSQARIWTWLQNSPLSFDEQLDAIYYAKRQA
jgi:hypothetical protein